jgi:hypothetical protein
VDIPQDRRTIVEPKPIRSACLVEGCPCKDPRIISHRRVTFYAEWARRHGETADRYVDPDPDWRELFRPWRERLSRRSERPDLANMTNGPSAAKVQGW